jgi:hypothetical protein
MINKILNFRKHKMNYLNRYIIYVVLYLISDLIGGSYKTGSIGLPIGGIFLAPLTLLISYFFAALIGFWVFIGFISDGFKVWLKKWHDFSLNLSLWFYDFALLFLFYTLLNGGLIPQ